MKQLMTGAPAHSSSSHPRVAAATVADVMRLSLTTVGQSDHVAAAEYLMKHGCTTALMVVDEWTGQPSGIITKEDVARAVADGKDLNEVRVYAVMTTRPVVNATTGLLGVIDITDAGTKC